MAQNGEFLFDFDSSFSLSRVFKLTKHDTNDFQVCCRKSAHWLLGQKWRMTGFRQQKAFFDQCKSLYAGHKTIKADLAKKSNAAKFMIYCIWERMVSAKQGSKLLNELAKELDDRVKRYLSKLNVSSEPS